MAEASESQQLVELAYSATHNICAFLDLSSKHIDEVEGMIQYLRRSKIRFAISENVEVDRRLVNEFWLKAKWNDDTKSIESTVQGKPISFNVNVLRDALQLNDELKDEPVVIKKSCVMGCFKRIGYTGEIEKGTYNKRFFPIEWRYFVLVVMHCLGARKAGMDGVNESLQMIMTSLILNKRFNIAFYIFRNMMKNINLPIEAPTNKPNKFLMYPRFMQIMTNRLIPEGLVRSDRNILKLEHMTLQSIKALKIMKKGRVLP